ncbi:MAG: Fur family ferric uptake transcriptional regulator [Sulfurimonas sp.]|jgi:Fur family ferric uptake transcriptional regulator
MQIEKIILDNNLKVTDARVNILEIFTSTNKPISYDDIKHDLKMDKATFYRNMSKFEEESIISAFESNDKKRYFEIKKNPHSHFICNKCNEIECIYAFCDMKLKDYVIEDIILKGICKNCNK